VIEAARDVRSASEFKEPLEEIDSVNLSSSSFIYESSCSLILFRAIEFAEEENWVRDTRAGRKWEDIN